MRFGKLTAKYISHVYKDPTGHYWPYWYCECDCGGSKIASASNIIRGHVTSCGCAMVVDLTGTIFGRLTVLGMYGRSTQPNGATRTDWLCKCTCGERTIVSHGNLTSGHTKSCGCLRCSAQEAVIKRYLVENGYNHIKEYIFEVLISTTGRPFRFDFALLDNEDNLLALVEYQGSQHYIEYPGYEQYGATERYISDPLKRKYCKQHNIPLYEIKYTENTLTRIDEITHTVYGNLVPSLTIEEGVTTISQEST